MVTSILRIIGIMLITVSLFGCTGYPADNVNNTETSVTATPVETTLPIVLPETLPSHSTTLIIEEHFYNLVRSNMELHQFIIMFGDECVRRTPHNSYAVIQDESGSEYFMFFDKSDKNAGLLRVDSGIFCASTDFLDFLLGKNPTLSEMMTSKYFWMGVGDKIACYTQEGIFLLTFPYSDYDNVRRLRDVEYYDYEDIPKESTYYTDYVWYILPEDRNLYIG